MESTTNKSHPSETRPGDQNEEEEKRQRDLDNTGDIQEKLKKVDVKTSSPTSLLAKNSLMLPTGVIGPSEQEAKTKAKTASSASATGKRVRFLSILLFKISLVAIAK